MSSESLVHDKELNNAIYDMIAKSTRSVFLISPYFNPPRTLLSNIMNASRRGVQVTLIIRDQRDETNSRTDHASVAALAQLQANGITIKWAKWLHAKIYISDTVAIITSINLLETSFDRSTESGVQISIHSNLFAGTVQRVNAIVCSATPYSPERPNAGSWGNASGASPSTLQTPDSVLGFASTTSFSSPPRPSFSPGAQPTNFKPSPAAESYSRGATSSQGFCISCRASCPLEQEIKPFCKSCFSKKKCDYVCDYCHKCGKSDRPKTLQKPLCRDCYSQHKHSFVFFE